MKSLHRAVARGAAVGLAWALGVSAAAGSDTGFLSPAAGDTLAAGVMHEARWRLPCARKPDADEMELLLSVDGGLTFPVRLTAELPRCASAFRWKVPALPAAHARLAVRTGREGRPETERIAFVSDVFRIASAESATAASLRRGPAEWWTEQALLEIGAADLLGGAWRGASECLHAPAAESDLDEPSPGSFEPPADSGAKPAPSFEDLPFPPSTPPRRPSGAPVPLRE